MSILNQDCSGDLAEAIDLLRLMHFAFEHASNERDWFIIRGQIGTALWTVEQVLARALIMVEGAPPSRPETRAH